MLYLICYDVAPADRQTLISGITDHDYQDALDNMFKIRGPCESDSVVWWIPAQTKSEFNQIRWENEDYEEWKVNYLWMEPRIAQIVKDASTGSFSEGIGFIGDKPAPQRARGGNERSRLVWNRWNDDNVQ